MANNPLLSNSPAGPRRRLWILLAVAALLAVAGGIAYRQWPVEQPSPANSFSHDDAEVDDFMPRNPGYIGIEACAKCHAQRVAEFKATTHFHACREPAPGEMPAGFTPGKGLYASRNPELKFESTQSGDHFVQTAIQSTPAGEKRTSANIDLMYGTGNGDQIYFTWKDDRLFEFPVAWLFPFHRWAEQPFDPNGSGNFLRTTTPRCLECHNTWIGHVSGTENQFQRSTMLLGISCEKCHGPGREHVAFHEGHPDAKTGEFVVKPRQLTRERQMDLCGQCHTSAPKRRGPAFEYRPGEPLENYFRISKNPHPENDHVADQVRNLRQSKCFQANDAMNCVTCHNPHRAQTAEEKTATALRACQKCHQNSDCRERERLPSAVRDDCVNCHMPRFTRIQVYFHVAEDQYVPPIRPRRHRIAIDRNATNEVLLNWHRGQPNEQSRREAATLTRSLADHWQAEAETLRQQFRFLAAIGAYREALRIDPSPAIRARLDEVIAIQAKLDGDWFQAVREIDQRQFSAAIETLDGMLKIKPDLAKAHGKLGTLYANADRMDLAITHLRQAARLDPDDPQGEMMQGWLALLAGNYEESAAHYRLADEIDPFNVKIHYFWGTALAKLKRWPEATEHFREAVKIDPNHEGACLSLAICLGQQNRSSEALRFSQRAARLTHFENPDALLALAETYAAVGRREEAEDIVAKSLALPAGAVNFEMRKRLHDIRSQVQRANK